MRCIKPRKAAYRSAPAKITTRVRNTKLMMLVLHAVIDKAYPIGHQSHIAKVDDGTEPKNG